MENGSAQGYESVGVAAHRSSKMCSQNGKGRRVYRRPPLITYEGILPHLYYPVKTNSGRNHILKAERSNGLRNIPVLG